MDFSLIFIGSTHGFVDDFLKQKEAILKVKPEFVLCEELEDLKLDSKEIFNKLFQKKYISNMTSFDEVEKLARLCFNRKIKLIGIDFHNFGYYDNLQRKIKNQEKLTKEEEDKLNKIISLREERHLDKILEYKKKTSRPIIIIIGCWHLREGSLLRNKLKNYKLVLPCDESNKPIFEPNKGKGIKYIEIVYNDIKSKNEYFKSRRK